MELRVMNAVFIPMTISGGRLINQKESIEVLIKAIKKIP
jgi:hypothetical protein